MTKQINRTAAMLLLVTLGFLGVHSFYMGKKNQGILYILAFTVGWFLIIPPIIGAICLLVEFYKLLTQNDEEFAAKNGFVYVPENKNSLAAGAIALLGGIYGMHFSYLNKVKAAKNRFLISMIPFLGLLFILPAYVIGNMVNGMMRGLNGAPNMVDMQGVENLPQPIDMANPDIYSTASNVMNIGAFSGLALLVPITYIALIVLSILSLVEAYKYFKYGIENENRA